MTINRLRPRWSEEELHRIYAAPHDHRIYGRGHAERVNAMIELGTRRAWGSAADLSCGNGVVIQSIDAVHRYQGDIAPGYEYHGPIEDTIHRVAFVDLFIMGETLEHLDDPTGVLLEVNTACNTLLLSTPIDNWGDTNAEHYWAWDRDGVEGIMRDAGFGKIEEFKMVDSRTYGEPYCYGVWLVSAR